MLNILLKEWSREKYKRYRKHKQQSSIFNVSPRKSSPLKNVVITLTEIASSVDVIIDTYCSFITRSGIFYVCDTICVCGLFFNNLN